MTQIRLEHRWRGGGSKGSSREPLPDAPPTLADAGIDRKSKDQIDPLKENTAAKLAKERQREHGGTAPGVPKITSGKNSGGDSVASSGETRDFAADYRAKFGQGARTDTYDSSVASSAETYCRTFGFNVRTAALVYAWTYDTGGGRPPKSAEKSALLTLDEFSKRDTVSKYRKAMEWAISEGYCEECAAWPESPHGRGSRTRTSTSRRRRAPNRHHEAAGFTACELVHIPD